MNKFIIPFGVLVVVVMLVQLFSGKNNKKEKTSVSQKNEYEYHKKDSLITRPEHEVFDILVEIFGDAYYVFPQVHLSSFLFTERGQGKGAFSHINQKSVDYLICDKAYIKPLIAIELDDRSHQEEERKIRDENVEQVLQQVNLPLVRIENHGSFDKQKIKEQIFSVL
jgi:hypothetical protein